MGCESSISSFSSTVSKRGLGICIDSGCVAITSRLRGSIKALLEPLLFISKTSNNKDISKFTLLVCINLSS